MRIARRTPLLSLALIAAVALAVAGCGSSSKTTSTAASAAQSTTPAGSTTSSTTSSTSSSGSSAGGGQVVKVTADPGGALKFTQTTLHAKAGKVTLELSNPSSIPHSVAVEGHGVDKDASPASPGQGTQVTVTLKKGTYKFYCPVPGHEAAGMKGTLIVS